MSEAQDRLPVLPSVRETVSLSVFRWVRVLMSMSVPVFRSVLVLVPVLLLVLLLVLLSVSQPVFRWVFRQVFPLVPEALQKVSVSGTKGLSPVRVLPSQA